MAEYKYVDWPGLQYYHGKVTELIDNRLRDCIKFGGECAFADLPSPDTPDLNQIFRVTDSFTVELENDWFDVSCWGRVYPAGTIMQVVTTTSGVVYKVFLTPTSGGGSVTPIDTYSKAEIDKLFVDKLADVYTKEEVVALLSDKLEAEDLESYATKEYVDTHVEDLKIDDLVTRVDSAEAIIANTSTQVESLHLVVDTNSSAITAIEGNIDSLDDSITDLTTDVDTIKSDYMKRDDGVSKDELAAEVTTQIDTQVETIVDTKIEEKITEGVTISSISYGTF